jgi:hypothetical protein
MDDQPKQTTEPEVLPNAADTVAGGADEAFGWASDESEPGSGGAGATAERMIAQLQSMIDQIATQAAPVVRQVGAKAAELAAAAADRAGPFAHKAADATADASVKIAERSRTIAADLRRDLAGGAHDAPESDGGATGTATAVLDAVEETPADATTDKPAEGSL